MLYSRKILKNIDKWLLEKEIIILNGPRQVGKTSLLKLIKKELLGKGISLDNIFYLNLEEINILDELNVSPENLLKYITDDKNKNYFLIDEIQYLDRPSNFLKHLYDKYSDKVKIITTGSSSLDLKAQLQDSLAGRKVSFLVKPLDFEEFLQFKKSKYTKYLFKKEIPQSVRDYFDKVLDEYLIYGGMPAVVLQEKHDLKQTMLREYVGTYINKDVRSIGKIENISKFNAVIKILADQIGNLLNISELSNTADVTRRKTEKYVELLEYTFVLNKVMAFRNNIRKQIVKMPKIYFFDLGIRNAVLGNFLSMDSRSDRGELFENFIFLELKGVVNDDNIFFYRTTSGAEIDFIIVDEKSVSLVEVKYKKLRQPIDARVLKGFKVSNYKKRMFVINRGLSNLEKDGVKYVDYRAVSKILQVLNTCSDDNR